MLEDLKSRIPTECIGVIPAKTLPKVKSKTHNNLQELLKYKYEIVDTYLEMEVPWYICNSLG